MGGAEPDGSPAAPTGEVAVEGLAEGPAANVRAHLSLTGEPCDAPRWRLDRLHALAEKEARTALRALGYYAPSVASRMEHREDCWRVAVQVDPGAAVMVTRVQVVLSGEAMDDPGFEAVWSALPLREGEVLDHGRYEDAKRMVRSIAAERGYHAGRFTRSELRVDEQGLSAEVVLEYDSGPRSRFGALQITGSEALDPGFVDRLIDFTPGDPYDASVLLAIDRALSDSGYFRTVEVRPLVGTPEGDRVPVEVRVTPRDPHRFLAGAGVTTDTGPRGRIGYENRRLNTLGHRLSASSWASFLDRGVEAAYRVPLAEPRTDWLALSGRARLEDTDTSQSEALELELSRTKQRQHGWLEQIFLRASRQDFEVGSQTGIATLLVPGVRYSRSTGDDPMRPSRGHRLSVELRGALEAALSDTSFLQLRTTATWLRGLPWGGRLIVRAEIGAMAVGDFKVLPPSERFFAGGDNSVRGYDFESLGPRDRSGRVVGGKYLGTGSVEYEHPVTARWSVALFADTGNAFDDFDEGTNTGVGAGLRWHSPIGPVRLDLAHPLDDETLARVHLRLGPDL